MGWEKVRGSIHLPSRACCKPGSNVWTAMPSCRSGLKLFHLMTALFHLLAWHGGIRPNLRRRRRHIVESHGPDLGGDIVQDIFIRLRRDEEIAQHGIERG